MQTNTFSIKESLEFGWGKTKANAWFLFLVGMAATLILAAMHSVWVLGYFAQIVVTIAVISVVLTIASEKTPEFGDLTKHLKSYHVPLNQFLVSLLVTIFVVLGTLLFILPGIYLAIRFMFSSYFVVDHENKKLKELLEGSLALTKGNFWNLFLFSLTVIILNILGTIPLGIGLLFTVPTTLIATAHVYRKLLAHHHGHHTVA